ncbi:MAG TPA: TetR/AcrR family transcriptional regulator [Pseudonocardiaceae bacterium]
MADTVDARRGKPERGGPRGETDIDGPRKEQERGGPRKEQQRSRVTRQRLMEAAVACLVEHGWSGTTTTVVAERAGVSRGAQLHHYPTRAELVVAAVAHVGQVLVDDMLESARALPTGTDRTEAVLQLLGDFFSGPLFVAALELWVAARTDPQLREAVRPLEKRLGREAHRLTVGVLGVDDSVPAVREAVQGTLDMVRGMGLANLLTDDTARRRVVIARWARILDTVVR